YQGISFAIPSNEARSVYERLREAGRVARGWLGIKLGDLDLARARELGFSGDQGVAVVEVTQNSPAEAAGLRLGDIILKWDGQPANDATNLSRLVARTKIGATVEIEIWRRGEQMKQNVTVGQRPPDSQR